METCFLEKKNQSEKLINYSIEAKGKPLFDFHITGKVNVFNMLALQNYSVYNVIKRMILYLKMGRNPSLTQFK